jgi:hypothetical protein
VATRFSKQTHEIAEYLLPFAKSRQQLILGRRAQQLAETEKLNFLRLLQTIQETPHTTNAARFSNTNNAAITSNPIR